MTSSPEIDQGEFVRALLDPDFPLPVGLKATHGKPPLRRFAIYRNNVVVGLIDALSERFPVCLRLVGDEFFRAMAQRYVRVSQPRAPMLFEYGEDFADFVAGFEPARELPYLPDVARLEYAMGRAYHAADATPLALDFVRSLPGHRLALATASFHPSTQVVPSNYPIVSIWRANMAPDPPQTVRLDHVEDALVVRPRLDVDAHVLPAGGSAFIETMMGGGTFGEALSAANQREKDFDVTATLRMLLASEALTAINIEPEAGRLPQAAVAGTNFGA
jgi:hypothetical protein